MGMRIFCGNFIFLNFLGIMFCLTLYAVGNAPDKDDQQVLVKTCGYEKQFIYVNTYNPTILDLHGVASAKHAHQKFKDFIKAAIKKDKEYVQIITGRGNHVNQKGDRGTLFNALPSWLNQNMTQWGFISSYPTSSNGAYILHLEVNKLSSNNNKWHEKKILSEGRSLETREKIREQKRWYLKGLEKKKRNQKQILTLLSHQDSNETKCSPQGHIQKMESYSKIKMIKHSNKKFALAKSKSLTKSSRPKRKLTLRDFMPSFLLN